MYEWMERRTKRRLEEKRKENEILKKNKEKEDK